MNLSIFIELFRNDKLRFRRPAPVLMTLFPTWPDSAIGDSSNGLPPGGDPRFRERRPRVEQGNGAPAQNPLLRGNAWSNPNRGEGGGALFRRVAGLGQVSSSRGMSLDGAYIQLLYEIREEMNLCPRAEENHEWAR